jgi:hypothetical protein
MQDFENYAVGVTVWPAREGQLLEKRTGTGERIPYHFQSPLKIGFH